MKKLYKFLLLVTVCLFVFTGCSFNSTQVASTLNTPDKIVVYGNGKQMNFFKKDKGFERVFELAKNRIPWHLGAVKLVLSNQEINNIRNNGPAVKLVYNKLQQTKIDNGRDGSIQYKGIIFLTDERWKNIAFLEKDNNSLSPIELYESMNDLVNSLIK